MKNKTNLTVLLGLLLILLATISGIWQRTHKMASKMDLKELSEAAAPAQTPPQTLIVQTDASAPEETALSEKLLSKDERIALAKNDLEPFFPAQEVEGMARVSLDSSNLNSIRGLYMLHYFSHNLADNPQIRAAEYAKLNALNLALDAISKRNEQQALLQKQLEEQAAAEWPLRLPLHRKNVSVIGPKGEKPLRREVTECTPWHAFAEVCEVVFYEGNSFSLFAFENDILQSREDYRAPKDLLAIYSFFPPPPYEARHTPQAQDAIQGIVEYASFWDSAYTNAYEENSYQENRLLAGSIRRNFKENTQQDILYDENGQFAQITYSQIEDLGWITPPNQVVIIEKQFPEEGSRFAVKGRYQDDIAFNVSGSWTATPDGTITLDDGRRFPPAQSFPRAPLYRDLYPAAPAQTAPELL